VHLPRAKSRHLLRIEASIGRAERRPLLEDGEPGQPGLIDLEDQPLEQFGIAVEREAVLGVMIGTVPLVAGGGVAVSAQGEFLLLQRQR
jgi:hypothetical protein